jgi:hypothetical protein
MVKCECGKSVDILVSATKKCYECTMQELERIRMRDLEENI